MTATARDSADGPVPAAAPPPTGGVQAPESDAPPLDDRWRTEERRRDAYRV